MIYAEISRQSNYPGVVILIDNGRMEWWNTEIMGRIGDWKTGKDLPAFVPTGEED